MTSRTLLCGEIVGLTAGSGAAFGATGAMNPYIALGMVLGALVLHLTARRTTQ